MALWEEEGGTVLSTVFCWETVDSGTYVNVILAHITNLNTAADSLHPVMAAVCSFFQQTNAPCHNPELRQFQGVGAKASVH